MKPPAMKPATPATPAPPAPPAPIKESDEAIYAVLSRLLLTGALPPGTQLIETRIAAIFEVSRERVRKVLHRLGHERLLELVRNKGAFVEAPSLKRAREIYEARRVTEGGIVARLAGGRLSKPQFGMLRKHIKTEEAAANKGDRAQSVRLSDEFHLHLAEATGSDAIISHLRELVSRTAMLVALFGEGNASHCACDEHRLILDRLEAGDVQGAINAMYSHLSLIETRLTHRTPAQSIDAEAVLRKAWSASAKARAKARAPAAHALART
jgi:DNA-binding GntR family transcriptional regulator